MKKKNEETKKFNLKEFILPKYNEIPDVGLYLEQVVKYINSYFLDYEDMYITPSMLTNYVKHKIVSKVSKKTYSRDQIAHFIFIAMTKNILSLNNISKVFEVKDNEFEKFYDYFIDILINYLKGNEDNNDNKEAMIINIVKAVTHKMELDIYFKNL